MYTNYRKRCIHYTSQPYFEIPVAYYASTLISHVLAFLFHTHTKKNRHPLYNNTSAVVSAAISLVRMQLSFGKCSCLCSDRDLHAEWYGMNHCLIPSLNLEIVWLGFLRFAPRFGVAADVLSPEVEYW